jgi:hypothetical protein
MARTPPQDGAGVTTCGDADPVFGPFLCARLPEEAVRRLKVQLAHQTKLASLFHLQVVDGRMTGPTPDHVEGRVVWRTVFGVAVATTTVQADQWSTVWDRWPGLLVWAALLLVELGLAGLLLWQLWAMP